jgi:hypothetical protein
MRNSAEILDQVKTALDGRFDKEFKSLLNDFFYMAPELEQQKIQKINFFIQRYIPYPPIEDWQINVVAALMNITPEKVKDWLKANGEK